MRLKLGLALGGAIGYVLGTRAGRERYDQIRAKYQELKQSPQAQQLSDEVERITEKAKSTVDQKTQAGVDAVTDTTQDTI